MSNTIKDFSKELLAKTLKEYDARKVRPIDERIDNIINNPGDGSTPTEVIDARRDITGVVHSTLGKRIDTEVLGVNQLWHPVEGNNISTDSLDGYLKNVEIKGNTVQNPSNLADIKSVGDKVEGQELYKIPLLCVGKNLFDGELERGSINTDGTNKVNANAVRTKNFIGVKPNTSYILSDDSNLKYATYLYDKNFNFIKVLDKQFTTSENTRYIRWRSTETELISLNVKYQLEEGTVATTYEAYKEHQITILSPVQLEKGDVLKEVDGVWGVEKNRVDKILTHELSYNAYQALTNVAKFWVSVPDVVNERGLNIISDKFVAKDMITSLDEEGICTYTGGRVYFGVLKSKISTNINDYIKNNPILIKYPTTTPTFIPLPHTQQIKLRTFANKTNISFLCDVEGTIKADVPKSLGATVNTHTTQIDSLNQELERVKKLEESTVSTVATESDFTVVEQTSNGYFEDIELKGRTLVNKSKIKYINFSSRLVTIYEGNYTNNMTLSVDINGNEAINGVKLLVYNSDGTNNTQIIASKDVNGTIIKFLSMSKEFNKLQMYIDVIDYEANLKPIINNIMLLEGDHTQNPPSYFEGLASVGDGTDEIVALSINNGNLINYENFTNGKWLNPDNGDITDNSTRCVNENYIPMVSATLFFSQSQPLEQLVIHCYDINKKWIGAVGSGKILNTKMTLLHGTYYVRYAYAMTNDVLKTNSVKLGLSVSVVDIAKADKKKLLYLDPVDNTWKKPVLDEFSTVKKGSDGVYRYHKRGEKDVFNGSESWNVTSAPSIDSIMFQLSYNDATLRSLIVSDKFLNVDINTLWDDPSIEGICINGDKFLQIRILKSKLPTQDLTGFKAWLQANNVTVVYQLAEEQVYECTNIDLITYPGETNFMVKSGVLSPRTTLKVHSNISNVVSLLQKKVSLLESNMSKYIVTQNRLMLTSRYNADTVSFKVDLSSTKADPNYDEDLFKLIFENIIVGKDNYSREYMENLIDFYVMDFAISWDMADILLNIIYIQYEEGNYELY